MFQKVEVDGRIPAHLVYRLHDLRGERMGESKTVNLPAGVFVMPFLTDVRCSPICTESDE